MASRVGLCLKLRAQIRDIYSPGRLYMGDIPIGCGVDVGEADPARFKGPESLERLIPTVERRAILRPCAFT